MTPLAPCLWRYEDIRAKITTEESLSATEREGMRREGYIEGAAVENPSVASLNTIVSGFAVTEFLDLLTELLPEGPIGYNFHYRLLDQTVEKVVATHLKQCVCSRSGQYWGYGDCWILPTGR